MTPELAAVVGEHLMRLRRAGMPTGPGAHLVPNLKWWSKRPQSDRPGPHQGERKGQRAAPGAGAAAAAEHHAAHATADLHLDRAVGEQLRCEVGDGAGRARGLSKDDGCLCAARAARQARPRREL